MLFFVFSLQHVVCVVFMMSTQLSSLLRIRSAYCFKKMLGLLQSTERHSFLVTVTPLTSLIVSDKSNAFGCSNNQKSRGLITGDPEGRLTAPTRPVRCRPEVCFRCCQTLRRRLKSLGCSDPGTDWHMLVQNFLSGYSSKTRNFWKGTHCLWGEKLEGFWHA